MKEIRKPRISLLLRIALLFILAFFLTSFIALANGRNYFRRMASLETRDTFLAGAASVVALINPETIEQELAVDEILREDLRYEFREICLKQGMDYLLMYTVDENGARHYLVSAGSTNERDDRVNLKRGYGDVVATALRDDQVSVLNGESEAEMSFLSGEYNCVWTTPVYDSEGEIWGLISAIYSVDHIIQMMSYYRSFIITTVGLFVGVSSLLALILLGVVVLVPIKELATDMKLFARDKNIDFTPKKHLYTDEITDIEESFGTMVKDITAYMDDIEKLTSEKVESQTQIDVARRIQEGIVPKTYRLEGDAYDAYGIAKPATEVGGDFYDLFFINEEELCIVNGDVSGKGISAALFMMVVKCALKEKIKAGISLEEAMNQTNQDACASNSESMFATVFAGILNIKTGVLRYANAGHNPPFIINEHPYMMRELDTGIAIGAFDDILIVEDEITLKKGEGILLYTDGITEALNHKNEMFGTDRLLATLEFMVEEKGENTAKNCCERVVERTAFFSENEAQFDDITCVALFYKG